MTPDPGSIEQAVSRALRENLEKLQRMAEEVNRAMADLVAACASSRPANALPAMLRAQTAAASLAAALEVLSRFITAASQPADRTPAEQEALRLVSLPPSEPEPSLPPWPPPRSIPVPMGESESFAPHAAVAAEALQQADMIAEGGPISPPQPIGLTEPASELAARDSAEPQTAVEAPAAEEEEEVAAGALIGAFDLASLPPEEQELHRRANRVAKVSMQDIEMLRPEEVRLGREHRDLCPRLRHDIEKAHKEYDRRFRPILGHPVDYFYHWMVEILAEGDPEALGEYPYPSPVLRR